MRKSGLVLAVLFAVSVFGSSVACAFLPHSPEARPGADDQLSATEKPPRADAPSTATAPSFGTAANAKDATPAGQATAPASAPTAPAQAAASSDRADGAPAAAGASETVEVPAAEVGSDEADDDDGEEPSEAAEAAANAQAAAQLAPGISGRRYTADLGDDDELLRRWKEAPESIGSASIGFADMGRLINGVPFPVEGPNWVVVDPKGSWATQETVRYTIDVLNALAAFDAADGRDVVRMRVNHLSKPEGGWHSPHKSHQSGRDVDLAFFYTPGGPDRGAKARRDNFDLRRNWALLRAIVTLTDVQMVLADRKIQKRLYDYALSVGEDRAWLESLFHAGKNALVKHAPRHKDHFHVRYFNGRAQELGRRLQPLLPKGKPELNYAMHRIRKGDNIGSLARKYGTTVAAIKKANRLTTHLVRVGRVITIPTARSCIDCPLPPEVIVPARRLPPTTPAMFSKLGAPPLVSDAAVSPSPSGPGSQEAAAPTGAVEAAPAPVVREARGATNGGSAPGTITRTASPAAP